MIIKVTQEHIDNGKRGMVRYCALALAMKDAGIPCPSVGNTIFTRDADNIYCGWEELPHDARIFRVKFDEHMHVTPFEFEIPDSVGV